MTEVDLRMPLPSPSYLTESSVTKVERKACGARDNGQRPRVLVLADVCNPDWPSLPVVGYNYAKALSEVADVTVATQVRNRPNIERDGLGRAQVVYLDTEWIAAPIHRLGTLIRRGGATGWTTQIAMEYPSYLAFEWAAWRHFRGRLRKGEFDVIHRITPMSPTLPSLMASLSTVPFVLGPLNGGLPWPSAFQAELKREREWLSWVRDAYKLLPFRSATLNKAAAILAAFDHTIADLPARLSGKIVDFPEVGVDPARFSAERPPKRERKTILFAGRLVPYKLPEVIVGAFARSDILRRHRLVVVGDGPERSRLEQMIAEHRLQDCVELLGQRTQREVGAIMRDAEIFAFPSIRELGAGVVVEAMACGMACVVVDYGAPGALIGPDRGVKVALGDHQSLIAGYCRELESLVLSPERITMLGAAASQHARAHYDWDSKAGKTLEVYHWARNPSGPKPDFWAQT
ncbi:MULTISPECIES: glycosyltransferase family 4 protein [Methylobacteriaceae]